MTSKNLIQLVKVLAKLLKYSPREMIEDGVLGGLESRPIHSYRCKFTTKLVGRKWLAPLYRPVLGAVQIKAKTFVAVRQNGKFYDVEFLDPKTKEVVVYTVKEQEWREKSGYFELIPPNRFRGSLGHTVHQIIQLRRGYGKERQ